MATATKPVSSEFSIPFAISHGQQSFRFFELPDELVDLVASGGNPCLQLKSSTESSSSSNNTLQLTPKTKSSEYVHVCSEELEKSWSVRQVSTSNEVYVVQALRVKQDATSSDTYISEGQDLVVLTAIAKTDSVLELLPASVDIEAHLRQLLPTYDHDHLTRLFEKREASSLLDLAEEQTEFTRVASLIPAPDCSVRMAWRQLCVSRSPQLNLQEKYFIPTTQLLEVAWNNVHAAYTIRTSRNGEIEKSDFEDDGEGMDELVPVKAALWTWLCSPDSWSLDREKTVTFVIRTQWESMWTSDTLTCMKKDDRSELEALWRELLPRQWNSDATMDKLDPRTYELNSKDGKEVLRWKGRSSSASAVPFSAAKPGKRKWHEKFRDGRNVKT